VIYFFVIVFLMFVFFMYKWVNELSAISIVEIPMDMAAGQEENTTCFIEFGIKDRFKDEPIGRVEFELFDKVVPKTAANFRALCTGEKGDGLTGKPLHYKGSKIHRIVPGFVLQGGDTSGLDGMG